MTDRKFPTPFYAAAGASEALVEELKKLPARVDELRGRSKLEERAQAVGSAVKDNVRSSVDTLRNLDGDKVRSAASETANTLGEQARKARVKAKETYDEFVERGENVANGERSPIKVIATIAQKSDDDLKSNSGSSTNTTAPKKPAAKKTTTKPAAKKTTKAASSK